MISDTIFATAAWGLLAWVGYKIFGSIEGIAIWRVFFMAATAGHLGGYVTRLRRDRLERERIYGPPTPAYR